MDRQKKFLMGVLTCETEIIAVDDLKLSMFSGNTSYIWVIHANKIPPHIGVSSGQGYYSLKSNGKDNDLAISGLISVLKKKNIAVLLYELTQGVENYTIRNAYNNYRITIPGQVTCLQPLKDVFNDTSAMKVQELLDNLEIRGMISKCYGWQLPEEFTGIPDYEVDKIHDRLKLLSND